MTSNIHFGRVQQSGQYRVHRIGLNTKATTNDQILDASQFQCLFPACKHAQASTPISNQNFTDLTISGFEYLGTTFTDLHTSAETILIETLRTVHLLTSQSIRGTGSSRPNSLNNLYLKQCTELLGYKSHTISLFPVSRLFKMLF